jgi:hypothetical protein
MLDTWLHLARSYFVVVVDIPSVASHRRCGEDPSERMVACLFQWGNLMLSVNSYLSQLGRPSATAAREALEHVIDRSRGRA